MTNQKALQYGLIAPLLFGIVILYGSLNSGEFLSSPGFYVALWFLSIELLMLYVFPVLLVVFSVLVLIFTTNRKNNPYQLMATLVFLLGLIGGFEIILFASYVYLTLFFH